MIETRALTRRFGATVAVDAVSFRAEPGTVTGFLGPNGAGKTTTLRLLTTFLAPTSGSAAVCGFDVLTHPLAVRRRVGYLCENAPLPAELRVEEYLRLRAEMKGLDRGAARRAVGSALERLELGEARARLIGQLSRGYRQRVGLADALLGDPPVLVLDEPTTGLDPDQVRRVRELLRELATKRTVFLSTHLLAEAERICGALVVIARGRVVAAGTPEEIARKHGGPRRLQLLLRRKTTAVELGTLFEDRRGVVAARRVSTREFAEPLTAAEALAAARPACCAGLGPPPAQAEPRVEESWEVGIEAGEDPAPGLVRVLVGAGVEVVEVRRAEATLEQVFLKLTGQAPAGTAGGDGGA